MNGVLARGTEVSRRLRAAPAALCLGLFLGLGTLLDPIPFGPDPDLDKMRLRLAVLLEGVDAYTEVFDPYVDPPAYVPVAPAWNLPSTRMLFALQKR